MPLRPPSGRVLPAVYAARRRARSRIATQEVEALGHTGSMTNEELAVRLHTLASELDPHTALRLATARLLRRSWLMDWASATTSVVADCLLLAGYLACAAWLGISPWVRGALALLIASIGAVALWRRL